MNNSLNQFYPESRFGGFSDLDGTIAFYNRVNSLLKKDFVVLDIGCGRGNFLQDKVEFRRNLRRFRGKVKKIIGIDVDLKARENPDLDDFKLIKNGCFPLPKNSVDLCVCDYVLEHIEKPDLFFKECGRVLKKNGYFCSRTSNSLGYIGLASKMIPQRKHLTLLKKVQDKRLKKDIFPKFYRVNSISRIKSVLKQNKFDYCVYGFSSEPAYSSFSKLFYWLTTILHRLTPNFFKETIFVFAQKK